MAKNTMNEAVPAIVGKDTMVNNAQMSTSPSSEQVANAANGTLGGTDAVAKDARMYMDFINGNGPYGTAGRDFSYSIFSLSLVNPAAAGAVLGVIGAGAIVYGIATSTYIRAVRTKKRLKKIYKGVVGSGYKTSVVGSFIFGLFGKSSGDAKLGWEQFQNQLTGAAETIEKYAEKGGISPQTIGTMSPKQLKDAESIMSSILSISYKNLYIPQDEIEKNSQYYNDIMKGAGRWKWNDAKVMESYDSIVKKMKEQTINAPIYAQKEAYKKRVEDLGNDIIKGFETKLAYSLKKGNEKAISCRDGLKSYWDSKMDEFDGKLDDAVLNVFDNASYKNAKAIVDAIYKVKSDVRLSPEMAEKDFTTGTMFIYQKSNKPVLYRLDDFTHDDIMNGILPLMICNTNITTGKGLYVKVPVDMLNKAGVFDRMTTSIRQGASSMSAKGVKYMSGGPEEGRIYELNYSFSSATTSDMLHSYVYVCDISDDPVTGKKQVSYVYINNGIGNTINSGVLQVMDYDKFSPRIYGEVVRIETGKKNESIEDDNSGELILEKSFFKNLFKKKDDKAEDKDKDKDKDDTKDETAPADDRIFVEIGEAYDALKAYAFVDDGTYVLLAKDRAIVKTGEPLQGKVMIESKTVEGLTNPTIKEWAELLPVQVPYLEDEDIDYSKDAMLDNNDAVLDNIKYPLTYGQFERCYMDNKYSSVYTQILYKHKDELADYSLNQDKNNGKYGLSGGTGGGPNSLVISNNFKKYLKNVIPDDVLFEEEPKDEEKDKDSEKNESYRYDNLTSLRESYFGDYSKSKMITEANAPKSDSSEFYKMVGAAIKAGWSEESINKLLESYKNGELVSGKDNSDKGEKEPEPVNDIPTIIPEVCKEIMKFISGYRKKIDDGGLISMFKSGPKAMAVKKSVYDEILKADKKSNDIGVESVDPNKKQENYSKTFIGVKDDEIAVLFVGPTTLIHMTKNSGKDEEVDVCVFKSDDKELTLYSNSKLLTAENFRIIRSVKGSDQANADNEKEYGIEIGSVYYVNRNWFDAATKKEDDSEEVKMENASFHSEFSTIYKLNEADSSDDRILVCVKSIEQGSAVLQYADTDGHIHDISAKLENLDKEGKPELYEFNLIGRYIPYITNSDIILDNLSKNAQMSKLIKSKDGKFYFWRDIFDVRVSGGTIKLQTSCGDANVPVLSLEIIKNSIEPDNDLKYMMSDEGKEKYYKISLDGFKALFPQNPLPKVDKDNFAVLKLLESSGWMNYSFDFIFKYKMENGEETEASTNLLNLSPEYKFETTTEPSDDAEQEPALKLDNPVIPKEYAARLAELKQILDGYLKGNPEQINNDIANFGKITGNATYKNIADFLYNKLRISSTKHIDQDIENVIRLIDAYDMKSPSWLTSDISNAKHLIYNDGKTIVDISIDGGKGAKNPPKYSDDKSKIIVTGSNDAPEQFKDKEITLDANNTNYILSESDKYNFPRLMIDEIKYKKHFLYGTPLNEAYTIFIGGGADRLKDELFDLVGSGKDTDICLLNILKKGREQQNQSAQAQGQQGNQQNQQNQQNAQNVQNQQNNPNNQTQSNQQSGQPNQNAAQQSQQPSGDNKQNAGVKFEVSATDTAGNKSGYSTII